MDKMKALVLVSGGLDSTTSLAMAIDKYGKENVVALSVYYGQKHTKEIEAAQLPNTLKDQDYAVINSNYAIQADLNPVKDSLLIEDSASSYGNILAVKEGNENLPKIKALVDTLKSDEIKQFINDNYNGGVIPYK